MKNYSEAIFGSSTRGDFDKYSDKDLLIVADNYEDLEKVKTQLSKSNWSVSFYTYSKLQYLAKNGSLFIKHLQIESKINCDYENKLATILQEYKPKQSYGKDIEDCVHYFDILKLIPNNIMGYAWFCDSLYVGFRNYLIFKNAENNIYEFSFIKLLKLLNKEGKITKDDIHVLKELRVVKRNYRAEILDELPSFEFVQKIISIINRIGIIKKPKFVSETEFKSTVESQILSNNYNPYQRLRLVEGYYCSQKKRIPELKKIISNPQFYALKLKDDDFTLSLIRKMKKRYTTKCIVHSYPVG